VVASRESITNLKHKLQKQKDITLVDRQLKHQLEHDKLIQRQLSITAVSAAVAAAKKVTGRHHASVYIKTDKEQRAARKQHKQEQKQHDHDRRAHVTGKALQLLSLPDEGAAKGEEEEEEEEGGGEEGEDEIERGSEINSPRDLLFVWIIHPTLAAKMCWDVFVALLIVYSVIFIPYRICFEQDSVGAAAVYVVEWCDWWCAFVLLYFCIVVLLEFCTSGVLYFCTFVER
jgi:hypothetical protein